MEGMGEISPELCPFNLESRIEIFVEVIPQSKENIWVKRKRKFHEEFKDLVWEYGQKEMEKRIKKNQLIKI
jgi:hypothetical protein